MIYITYTLCITLKYSNGTKYVATAKIRICKKYNFQIVIILKEVVFCLES